MSYLLIFQLYEPRQSLPVRAGILSLATERDMASVINHMTFYSPFPYFRFCYPTQGQMERMSHRLIKTPCKGTNQRSHE